MMGRLRDKFWIWGHPAGSHDNTGWGLDGLHSRMTPCECAWYLGIPNVIMVCYNDNPKPPFEQEALALDCLRETIWSLVGNSRSNPNADSLGNLEEVLKIARTHPNITGTMFDDFFSHGRDQVYTPEMLKTIRSRLQNAPGGPLDMWVVVYDYVLDHPMQQHLEQFDGVTYWTWVGKDLSLFDANFAKLKQVAKGKQIMALDGIVLGLCMKAELPIVLCILIMLAVSVLTGAYNAVMITQIKVNPFITTLAGMQIFRGAAYLLSKDKAITLGSDVLKFIGRQYTAGIPNAVILMLILVIVFSLVAKFTTFGRRIYVIGGNQQVAWLSGIAVKKNLTVMFLLHSLLCGVCGSGKENAGHSKYNVPYVLHDKANYRHLYYEAGRGGQIVAAGSGC